MGEIRNARCLLLQWQWNQYGDPRVDPIGRSLTGSITPIMTWILYADHQVDPMGRSLTILAGQPCRLRGVVIPVEPNNQAGITD